MRRLEDCFSDGVFGRDGFLLGRGVSRKKHKVLANDAVLS
jgi:hypothetical protein